MKTKRYEASKDVASLLKGDVVVKMDKDKESLAPFDEKFKKFNAMDEEKFERFPGKKRGSGDGDAEASDSENDEEFERYLDAKYGSVAEDEDDENEEKDDVGNPYMSRTLDELDEYLTEKYGEEPPEEGTPEFDELTTDLGYLAFIIKSDLEEDRGKSQNEDKTENEDEGEDGSSIAVVEPKFRVKRGAFVSVFTRIAECASKWSKYPTERRVKVVANHSGIFLSATNGEFTALEKIVDRDDFYVSISGAFLVDPDDLMMLFSESTGNRDEMLVFALHFSSLTIKGARFRYRFSVEDAFIPLIQKDESVEFEREEDVRMDVEREIPEFCEEQGYFEMESDSLKRMIRRTLGAVDNELERSKPQEIAFFFGENETTAFTRGYLGVAWQKSPSQFVRARKADAPFSERFLEGSERVQIALSGERAQIQTENALLTFRAARETYFPSLRFFIEPNQPAPKGELYAGDLATALRCVIGNAEWSNDFDDYPVTLELRDKRLVLARNRRLMKPPIVEVPLKYVGNRTSVVLNALRLYDFVGTLPPDEPVVIRVYGDDALFETRDGFQFLASEAEEIPF